MDQIRRFIGFNPTLVRLRLGLVSLNGFALLCFNPTLVRLRLAPPLANRLVHIEVSIPRWFD